MSRDHVISSFASRYHEKVNQRQQGYRFIVVNSTFKMKFLKYASDVCVPNLLLNLKHFTHFLPLKLFYT